MLEALSLRSTPLVQANANWFVAAPDSPNASILKFDAVHGAPEFDLVVKEAAPQTIVTAGQKYMATGTGQHPDLLAKADTLS